ncbi:MAG: hypothetical protein Q4E60_10895 [Bacteroidales bacterium]|nr:hypothetical protein [Bacteroidales bacterium]
MIVKLRIESSKEEIRKFTDKLRADETLKVNSISEIYPNNRGISIYDRCFAEVEFKENSQRKGETLWQQ